MREVTLSMATRTIVKLMQEKLKQGLEEQVTFRNGKSVGCSFSIVN